MSEERERMSPEELGNLASIPFKTETKKKTIVDDDGYEFEIVIEVKKLLNPNGEIQVVEKETSRFVSCGHQVVDPKEVMRCVYEGHTVCKHCIRICDGCGVMVCLAHSEELHDKQGSLRLCWDCEDRFKLEMIKENSIFNKIFGRRKK